MAVCRILLCDNFGFDIKKLFVTENKLGNIPDSLFHEKVSEKIILVLFKNDRIPKQSYMGLSFPCKKFPNIYIYIYILYLANTEL